MKCSAQSCLLVLVLATGLCSVELCRAAEADAESADGNPPPGTTGNADNVPFIGGRDANGNPVRLARKTGHVSNYDESKVPEYTLPAPLRMSDGRAVTAADQWPARRAEILRFYEEQIYGRIPENAPAVTWQVTEPITTLETARRSPRKLRGPSAIARP